MDLYALNVMPCFVMFSKFLFLYRKNFCTEEQVSKLSGRLRFSCRFPVVAKCSEISFPITKAENTNHVLNNLNNFTIYHNLPQFSDKFVCLH